ncbi:MAG: rhomboid family intramembrane serine protease [Congregibacter sp.]
MSVELYRTALDDDLRPLSALLWQQQVPHRVAEEGGMQLVKLARAEDEQKAQRLLAGWKSGELQVTLRRVPRATADRRGSGAAPKLVGALLRAPVTGLLIFFSVAGFLLVYLDGSLSVVSALTFEPFTLEGGRVVFSQAPGQAWRLLTPVFLHFGWMHIVFNSLWCWDLGGRIESALGSVNLAGLFLVTAILSNYAQHLWTGPLLFGGLSGVVYGFLGFAWVAGKLNPRWNGLAPATPIMLFMVGWLLICVLGFVDVLGFSVANAAHVGGLLTGAILGAVLALVNRASA